jgi:hypothetical protein
MYRDDPPELESLPGAVENAGAAREALPEGEKTIEYKKMFTPPSGGFQGAAGPGGSV